MFNKVNWRRIECVLKQGSKVDGSLFECFNKLVRLSELCYLEQSGSKRFRKTLIFF